MNTKILRTVVFSIAVLIGSIGVTTAPSNAGSFDIDFSLSGPGYYFSTGRGYRSHRYRDHRYRGDYDYRRRVCKPRRALRKARRMGVRDAHIVRVNRRVIVVKGYRYGYPAKVKFGRSRNCRVIAFRRR